VTSDDAARFVKTLAARLGVDATHAQPGFEDVYYYMLRERRLPVNVDVLDNRVEDEMERARIAVSSSAGSEERRRPHLADPAVGAGRWQSGPWFLRREHCSSRR
jgi:uncharacterized protein (DUF2126 family)